MPAPQKVSWSKLRVGITASVAMLILAVLIFLFTTSGNFFKRKVELHTFVDDASGTAESAPVRLNGIPIGNVSQIRLVPGSKDPKRQVEFVLLIQAEHLKDIPKDSLVAISASNLLGEKFINITRGNSPTPVAPGAELPSSQVKDIPEMMADMAHVLTTFQGILTRLDVLVGGIESGQGNIGKLLKDEEFYNRLTAVTAEGQQLLLDVRHGKGTLSRFLYDDSLYQDLRSPLKRMDEILASVQTGQGTASKLLHDPKLFDEVHATIAEIRKLVSGVNEGKGTAGKLLNDDQLSTQLNLLVAKLNSTVDKITAGQGTLGQLLTNPQMYDALNGATREMQTLVRDMHANPKKFLTIQLKLF